MKTILSATEIAACTDGISIGTFGGKTVLKGPKITRGSGVLIAVRNVVPVSASGAKPLRPIEDFALRISLGLDFGRAECEYLFGAVSHWGGDKNHPMFQILDVSDARHIMILATISAEDFCPDEESIMAYTRRAHKCGLSHFRISIRGEITKIFATVEMGYKYAPQTRRGYFNSPSIGAERRVRLARKFLIEDKNNDWRYKKWREEVNDDLASILSTRERKRLSTLEENSGYAFILPDAQGGINRPNRMHSFVNFKTELCAREQRMEAEREEARKELEALRDEFNNKGLEVHVGNTTFQVDKSGPVKRTGVFTLSPAGVRSAQRTLKRS